MPGISKNDIELINGMLFQQKDTILKEVKNTFTSFKDDVREDLSNLNESVRMLAGLASSAKGIAEKVHTAIEGNGSIGIKTQVRNNHSAINSLAEKMECNEKETLKEKIKDAESSGELKEKKYNRRAEDKRARRKDIFYLVAVIITASVSIIIQLLNNSGGQTP